MARSVAPSSRAPALDVIAPPSKPATTARPSTAANSNSVGLHSIGIGELLCAAVLARRSIRIQGSDALTALAVPRLPRALTMLLGTGLRLRAEKPSMPDSKAI